MNIKVYATDSNLVTIGFVVHSGSYNETKDTLGIAHLTEHLVFRGTEKFTNEQTNTYIESLGGYLNAYTTYEYTKFYCTVPCDKWQEAIDFLIQIVFYNTIPEETFDIEKDIVINELKMYQDDPQSIAYENLYKLMFTQYNKKMIGGTPETVAGITRQQVIDYINDYYISSNIDLIATGNIDPNELQDYINNNIPFENNIIKPVGKTVFNNQYSITQNKQDINQSVLVWGMILPPSKHKDYEIVNLINNYLGGNTSSILYNEIREKQGLCYTINTSIEKFNNYSILNGYTSLNKDNIDKVCKTIVKEFQNINITQEQLDNNKQYLIGQHLMSNETTSGLNEFITTYGIDYDKVKLINNITLDDVNKVKQHFVNNIYFSTVIAE